MTFKLTRKGHIYFANLNKILVVLLMKKEKRNCTTRTRVNDSMSFAIKGQVSALAFCYADFFYALFCQYRLFLL